MADFVWFLVMAIELIFAFLCANNGEVALTILFCFSAYCCLHFMEKKQEGK